MFIYVGKNFTATAEGRKLEEVHCDKCRTRFFYELVRVGTGTGTAPYYIGQDAAARRAEAAAQKAVAKRLAREAEMVPCPKCHWVNEALVARYRKRKYRQGTVLAVALAIAGVVGGVIVSAVLGDSHRHGPTLPTTAMAAVAGGGLAAAALVLLVRRMMRLRIDPNSSYPRRPSLPVGTPPPLVETTDPRTGQAVLAPVPVTADGGGGPGTRGGGAEWAVFRPGQVVLPPVCCVCLAGAATVYKPPMKVSENSDIEVPLCAVCAGRIRARWWLTALAVTGAALSAAGLVALLLPRGVDETGRWIAFTVIGLFATLIGAAVVPARLCRPYRYGIIDADRGIARFAAQNPRYTDLLVQQVRQYDGLDAG